MKDGKEKKDREKVKAKERKERKTERKSQREREKKEEEEKNERKREIIFFTVISHRSIPSINLQTHHADRPTEHWNTGFLDTDCSLH
jgi:hypothetical protein